MKTLELNQMENLQGGEYPTDCTNYNMCVGLSAIAGGIFGMFVGIALCTC